MDNKQIFAGANSSKDAGQANVSLCSDISKRAELKITPGFLTASLPYVGHHDCTDTGVCRNIPFICKSSSCCRSEEHSNGSMIHCGCLDSKGSCVPVRSIRLGLKHCNLLDSLAITSELEIAHIAVDSISCHEAASVEFVVGATGEIELKVKVSGCLNKATRIIASELTTEGGATGFTITVRPAIGYRNTAFSTIFNQAIQRLDLSELIYMLGNNQLHQIKTLLPNVSKTVKDGEDSSSEIYEKCMDTSFAVFSMCPSFLPNFVGHLQSIGFDSCGASGQCRPKNASLTSSCISGKHCCVLSKDFGRQKSNCECVQGITSCLEYKELQINLQTCSESVHDVDIHYNVFALAEGVVCEEMTSKLETEIDDSGNIQVDLDLQKCVPVSSSGKNNLLVKYTITVRKPIQQLLNAVKAYIQNLDTSQLVDAIGMARMQTMLSQI